MEIMMAVYGFLSVGGILILLNPNENYTLQD